MGLSILHANANVLMANGLTAVLQNGGGIEKIKIVATEAQMIEELRGAKFDLVVIDPIGEAGFSASSTQKLKEQFPDQKVLIISEIESPTKVLRNLEKGVHGYLTRQCDTAEIIHAVFSIAKGEKFYCNKVLDIILNKDENEEDNCEPTALSERESEVTAMIASGMTNKEIAESLFLSPHTVHTHRKNILKKLGVKSASELTVYAINVGLIKT